jgi:hypothetical protein
MTNPLRRFFNFMLTFGPPLTLLISRFYSQGSASKAIIETWIACGARQFNKPFYPGRDP